jgi:Flp pilus assembly protein TadD
MRYALYFALSIIALTTGAVLAFDHISVTDAIAVPMAMQSQPTADTLPTLEVATPVNPTAADYARFADADREWRAAHARQYTIAELRARGDGKRTARDSVHDRVFAFMEAGQRRLAIRELERWVAKHPSDRELLLSLARLLTEDGRSDAAIGRYRQLLSLRRTGE